MAVQDSGVLQVNRSPSTKSLFQSLHNVGVGSTGSKERTSAIEDKKPESAGHQKNKFKLELPKFSGDPMEWYDFWKMFQTLIESEDLGDVEKIQHLLMSMQSEEAKSIVTYASIRCLDVEKHTIPQVCDEGFQSSHDA